MSLVGGIGKHGNPIDLHIGVELPPGVTEASWAAGVRAFKLRQQGLAPESPVDPVVRLLVEEKARELGLAPEAQPVSLGQGLQKTPWLVLAGGVLVLWMVSRGQPARS